MTTSEAPTDAPARPATSRRPATALPPAVLWVVVGGLLLLWIVLLTPFGRPLFWDEAVFVSQSGGLEGAHPPAWGLAASREHGTYTLIRLVRLFAESLGSIELLWAVVVLALVVLAFAVTSRQVGRRAALVGLVAYATMWVPVVMFTSFYGSQVAAAAGLLGTSLYLRLRDAPPRAIWIGVATGLALALMCWMRTLEAALCGGVLVAHAVLWRPRDLLRRWRAVSATVAAFVLAFALPWVVVTVHRWGSLGGWLHAGRSQGQGSRSGFPIGLYDGIPYYAKLLVGRAGAGYSGRPPAGKYLGNAPLPVAVVVGAGCLVAAVLVIVMVVAGLRRVRPQLAAAAGPERHGATALYAAQLAVGLGFFLFLGQDMQDRYLMFGLIFAAVLAGGAVDLLVRHRPRPSGAGRLPVVAGAAVVVLLLGWLAAQAEMTRAAEAHRVRLNRPVADVARLVRVIDHGRPCHLMGALAAANAQIFTDCSSIRTHTPLHPGRVNAATTSRHHPGVDYSVFVLWREGTTPLDGLGKRWTTLRHVYAGDPQLRLSYRLAGPAAG